MWKNLRLKTKLIAVLLLVGLAPLAALGWISTREASEGLQNQAFNQLISLRDVKKRQIEAYLDQVKDDVEVLAGNPYVWDCLRAFEQAFASGVQGPEYRETEAAYGAWLTEYLSRHGYYDLFLISENGDIVYTVVKEPDFGTNLISGPYRDQNLARLFVQSTTETVLVDFEPYAPSNDAPAAFVGAPCKDADGVLLGVVALQVPIDQIDVVMQERSGMGESGETYLVGPDHLMRSNSRFSATPTMLSQVVETRTCLAALDGRTGAEIVEDYHGVTALSAFAPLNAGGLDWCILAEIDRSEAFAPIYLLQRQTLTVAAVGALLVLLIGWLFSRALARPLTEVARIAERLAVGDINQSVTLDRKDEIGTLSRSFARMIQYIREVASASREIAGNNLTITVEPRSPQDVLGHSFKTMIENLSGMIHDLNDRSLQLVSTANEIASSSDEMARGASDQANQMSQVSTSIEEMSATIVQSSRSASEASSVSQTATETAGTGGQIVNDTIAGMTKIAEAAMEVSREVDSLAQSAGQIGEIITVIDDIADQTNLLALNAAIEAARAGEQGRGFAVVADEVRKLAERTAQATGKITRMIKDVQEGTGRAVKSIADSERLVEVEKELADQAGGSLQAIVQSVGQVMTMIQQIATAAEQQAVTAETISKSVESVNSITRITASGAEQSARAAEELNRHAESLINMVSLFKLDESRRPT